MTLHEAKETIVPFGRSNGWPLSAVIERRFSEFSRLSRQRATLFGDVKEALDVLTADPEIAAKLKQYRVQRKTELTNRFHLNSWAMR